MNTVFKLRVATVNNESSQCLEYISCEHGMIPHHYTIEIFPHMSLKIIRISLRPDGYRQTIELDCLYVHKNSLTEYIKELTIKGWTKT